jgi:hypothetical protein
VGLRLERVPEEDEHVDRALDDLGADLQVAAERAARNPLHRELEAVVEQAARRAGGDEPVAHQRVDVEPRPLEQVLLAVVVRDEGDASGRGPPAGGVGLMPGACPVDVNRR